MYDSDKTKEYWDNIFRSGVYPTNIRLDFKRDQDYIEKEDSVKLDIGEMLQELLSDCQNENKKILGVLVAALNICLVGYTNEKKIVIGTPSRDNGRKAYLLINEIDPSEKSDELIGKIQNNLDFTFDNEEYTTDYLMEQYEIADLNNKCSLFDIGIQLTNFQKKLSSQKNDITFSFEIEEHTLEIEILYNTELYRKETIERLGRYYSNILETIVGNKDVVIEELIKLSSDEQNEILKQWNDTEVEYDIHNYLHKQFEKQVTKHADDIAVRYGEQTLTYKELNEKANKLAHYLVEQNVKANTLVGLFLNRSLEMIIGLLAIVKAGGAYIPIDPIYPQDRVKGMLVAADVKLVITKEDVIERMPENVCSVISMDKQATEIDKYSGENMDLPIDKDDLSYVIFTSGSTGVPKAASVHHQGWINLLNWATNQFGIDEKDKVLVITSFSFDITQRNIMLPLVNGGELHLIHSEYFEPKLILEVIEKHKITNMNCPPSMFYQLIEDESDENFKKLSSLRYLYLGGEATSPARLEVWKNSKWCKATVVNFYGVAECSDVSIFHVLGDVRDYVKSSVPSGRPAYNTQIYIMNEDLELVRTGVVGEICIAGDGVGKGYVNDKELTAKKFVPDPFSDKDGAVLYRTGDLGRFLPDGQIEFFGRSDYQVKVRGLRIELGEVESVICLHERVKDAVVVVKEFGKDDVRMIAYIVPEDLNDLDNQSFLDDVCKSTGKKLPKYMLPNFFFTLEKMPLNPNGKADRKALKNQDLPEQKAKESSSTEEEMTDLQKVIMKYYKKFLNSEDVSLEDNLFDIGGHSMMMLQIMTALNKELEITLSPLDILLAPSVSLLSKRIEENYL